jgi:hypothetical protein
MPRSPFFLRQAGQLFWSFSSYATTSVRSLSFARRKRVWATMCWMSKCQSSPGWVALPIVCSIVPPLGSA